MELKEKFSQLESSKEFKDWKAKNSKSFLAHIFRLYDEANENIWQFGFYNENDTITTFIYDKEIKLVPEEKIFKQDDHKLKQLNLDKVKISFEDAMAKAEELREKKYSAHPVLKKFAILQIISDGQVFNITFVTQTFNTLNIHINSESGKIIADKLTNLMDIAKIEKGKGGKPDYIG